MHTHSKQSQEKLWAAAEQLRANGSLKLNEISEPILGPIFLKFADVRFKRLQKGISEARTATYGTRKRPVSPMDNVDFQARMKELAGEWTALTTEAHKLEKKIQEDWGKIL